jgi:hypothetical protein
MPTYYFARESTVVDGRDDTEVESMDSPEQATGRAAELNDDASTDPRIGFGYWWSEWVGEALPDAED